MCSGGTGFVENLAHRYPWPGKRKKELLEQNKG